MDININILTDQEAAILRETIAASHRIVVCAHKSPDGDAIGSSLGWAGYLRSLDKKVDICVPDMVPDSISWLPGAAGILRYDRQPELVQRAFDEADLVCCVDFSSEGRLDEMDHVLLGCKTQRVIIDHHLAPNLEAKLLVSQPHASSASDLVFRVVWQLGGFPQMDQTWATCIYCGMMTDTGGFTYNSTQPYIYYIICLLLTKNIDKDKIYRNVFNNARIPAVRFRGYLMNEKLQVVEGLHASFYTVTRKELKKYDFIKGDLEGLVKRIEELGFHFPITEKAKEMVAKKGYDVQFGARPLRRAIQTYIEDSVCEMLLDGTMKPGDTISVGKNSKKEELTFKKL